ncbi:MAG: methyltransferase domain-containing protein [Gammaproteobacteria bacterium]|nr:methyltransferase domain-containing protein [Gammaproteobacteria bacterium]
MDALVLKDSEFALFQKMIYETAGINMSDAKKALVSGRLAKRVKHYGLSSFGEYFKLLNSDKRGEFQMAVDLLTTNETFFFREPKHFDFLRERILPHWLNGPRRIWSAASSSGEEAYTLAMVLAAHARTASWEIVGTDISTRVLQKARSGHYIMERSRNIPDTYLKKYCLKGTGTQDGTFLIGKELRDRVSFRHANLKTDLSQLGGFDLIMLRNVLIYFDIETKQQVVAQVVRRLKPGGYLMVGHSESLNGISRDVDVILPSVYRKS